ncbi:hypothetical protein F5Y15DRAFT_112287 [Xylariaceae sp. FL0016]|nr:hypothetical protein F5Y15DRAFT_112287 [Xylariaceae sp. FL0016]
MRANLTMLTSIQFHLLAKMQTKPYGIQDILQSECADTIREAVTARRQAKNQKSGRLMELMPSLIDTIPTRNVCDQTVDCYMRTFEPIFRILHVPSFRKEYVEYWASKKPAQDAFLMKLIMVITIGSVFLPDRTLVNDIRFSAQEWVYVVQWWLVGVTERQAMSLNGVQIFCLLLLARQTNSLGGASSIASEGLTKLAFTVGLHLDPRTFPSMSRFESEMRRRLWITVLEIMTMTALNSSLPLTISPDEFSLRMPTDIADSDIESDACEHGVGTGDSSSSSIDCSIQLLWAKSLHLRMQICRQLNNVTRNMSYQETLEHGKSMKTYCLEIVAHFHQKSSAQSRGLASDFHRKFLDSYLRRIILLLHRPFAIQARKKPQFFLARKIALEASIAISSNGNLMDLASGGFDDYAASCITGSGLFKGLLGPDVICAIASEIFMQMEEEEEEGIQPGATTSVGANPLVLLSRRLSRINREPLMQLLKSIREQWRHIIRMGRPSLKQYIFLSMILCHIGALENGDDPKSATLKAMKEVLQECTVMLHESGAYSDASDSATAWTSDTSPFDSYATELFGFEFSTLEPLMCLDVPDWLQAPQDVAMSRGM